MAAALRACGIEDRLYADGQSARCVLQAGLDAPLVSPRPAPKVTGQPAPGRQLVGDGDDQATRSPSH